MARRFRALVEADEEVDNAIAWYQLEAPGTGLRFFRAYSELIAHARDFPNTGRALREYEHGDYQVRSFQVSPIFPYTVFLAVSAGEIVILAVAHQHREPHYWAQRLEHVGR
jgi:plasmid stabilization system protein ParE